MLDIHRAAASGFAKGAATYVKGRPDYPPEVGDWLRTDLALSKGKTVLDLGAGSFYLTISLLFARWNLSYPPLL